MKAWLARNKTDDEGTAAIVFAETAGKAKAAALHTAYEGGNFTDISVSRLPKADKMYKLGKREMDWNDPKDRLFMVNECGFYCVDKDEKLCRKCNAKKYCYWYESEVHKND